MRRFSLGILAVSLLAPAAAQAEITVTKGRAFATAATQENGAVFIQARNTGTDADKLTGVSGDVAEKIEMHTHVMEKDVMQMRPVPHYDIPAHGRLVMEPTGDHIMLMGLKKPLEAGSTFPLTLQFEKAGTQTVEVNVIPPGAEEEESGPQDGDTEAPATDAAAPAQ